MDGVTSSAEYQVKTVKLNPKEVCLKGPLVPSQDLPIQDSSWTDHHGWVSWLCLDQNESRNTVTAPKTCHFQVGRYKGSYKESEDKSQSHELAKYFKPEKEE